MADSFQLEVATPERQLVNEHALRSQIPTPDGYIGVLPDHAALISELGIGVLSFANTSDQQFALAVREGFIEIRDNHVRVVADRAEFGSDVKRDQAEQELHDAEQQMMHPGAETDTREAVARYKHAQARVDAARESS
ncbi:MAG TPA: ATP synthase F1 subunit epsilon [Bryobacteraceae bacterium]|nr:ATP synthase F1 subunit epsilon [Bryobacteraceae bacterium]